MKKFRFSLQTVLDYRKDQVDLVQQKLAGEERIRQDILQRLREFDQLIEQAIDDQREVLNQSRIDIRQAQYFPQYLMQLKERRFYEVQRLQQQEAILLQIRQELKQALIKMKSLDVLKDKQHNQFLRAIDKAEEETLSDITMARIARRIQQQNQQSA